MRSLGKVSEFAPGTFVEFDISDTDYVRYCRDIETFEKQTVLCSFSYSLHQQMVKAGLEESYAVDISQNEGSCHWVIKETLDAFLAQLPYQES